MEAWRQELYTSELYHHGILGQKWGVRRFQNYDGTRIKTNEVPHNNQKTEGKRSKVDAFIDKFPDRSMKSLDSDTAGILTEAGIEAGIVATMMAVGGIINHIRIKKRDKILDEMKEDNEVKDIKDLPRKSKETTARENMKIVNPGYPKNGRTENCVLCTMAMVMQEKGYDVQANENSDGFADQNIVRLFNGKVKAKSVSGGLFGGSYKMFQKMERQVEDGQYGNLNVTWVLGGGHSVFWKKENGRLHIYDGQCGEEYNIRNRNSDFVMYANSTCSYIRLDNAEPNNRILGAITRRNNE